MVADQFTMARCADAHAGGALGYADIRPRIRFDEHRASVTRRNVPANLNMRRKVIAMRIKGKPPEYLPIRDPPAGNGTIVGGMPVEFARCRGVFRQSQFARFEVYGGKDTAGMRIVDDDAGLGREDGGAQNAHYHPYGVEKAVVPT